MTDVTDPDEVIQMLKKRIMRERKERALTLKAVREEKTATADAKSKITELVTQISDYKAALELEKEALEQELSERDAELVVEAEKAAAMRSRLDELQRLKQQQLAEIERLEQQHESELSQQDQLNDELKRDTLDNLETLMAELQRIELANDELSREHDVTRARIEEQRRAHGDTREQLEREAQRLDGNRRQLQQLQHDNDQLLGQLKHYRRQSLMLGANPHLQLPPAFPAPAAVPPKRAEGTLISASSSDDSQQPRLYAIQKKLEPRHPGGVCSGVLVPAAEAQVWLGCADGSVCLWDVSTLSSADDASGKADKKYHKDAVEAVCVVKDKVWTVSRDRSLIVWNHKKQPEKKAQCGYKDKEPWGTALLECDSFVCEACSDGVVRLWDPKSLKVKKELKLVDGHAVTCLLRKGSLVWAGTSKGSLTIFNPTTLKQVRSIGAAHAGGVHALCSATATEVWSAGVHTSDGGVGEVACWQHDVTPSSSEPQPLARLKFPSAVLSLLLVPQRDHVLLGTQDAVVYICSARTRQVVGSLSRNHQDAVRVLMSVDNRVWTGSLDDYVCIWQ
eukprot:TRINITY_DN10870_c0_g1_i1.p1 TRINITY_DN10870_c0_g1~~TRINITY_DN10870_c0_g1_i1.p1  ORF type:complete len:564 (+),score=235.55 TRINITY_DN10870_c0_g1_i1:1052-2743(+)